ncbi:MAG: hypothetical protein DMG13_29820 [Acidobacteria bacterium]|nr:MAG: hypothetical protein DMG13_29820 [Acidobacteriota bacterium]
MSLYEIPVRTIDGDEVTLEPYRAKALLTVNVASLETVPFRGSIPNQPASPTRQIPEFSNLLRRNKTPLHQSMPQ